MFNQITIMKNLIVLFTIFFNVHIYAQDSKEILNTDGLSDVRHFMLPIKNAQTEVYLEVKTNCTTDNDTETIENGVYFIMNFLECKSILNKTERFIKIAAKGKPVYIKYNTNMEFLEKAGKKVSYLDAKNYIDDLDYKKGVLADSLYLQHSYNNQLSKLVKIEDKINYSKDKGLIVLNYNATESDYSGTGARFNILNFSTKPIKKIYVTFYGTNKNNQKVYLSKDKLTITKLLTELLEPNENIDLKFNKIWNTNSVEYIIIKSFKIIYLDDKEVTIPYDDNLYIPEDKLNEYLEFIEK